MYWDFYSIHLFVFISEIIMVYNILLYDIVQGVMGAVFFWTLSTNIRNGVLVL
uniref:Bis5'-adenosyl-triphosphatase-like n=1 Tax=Rhizophora mucronata TaxID=61149 RepID=A0A2P2K483_RHIMU